MISGYLSHLTEFGAWMLGAGPFTLQGLLAGICTTTLLFGIFVAAIRLWS